jgi:hypothetical protein
MTSRLPWRSSRDDTDLLIATHGNLFVGHRCCMEREATWEERHVPPWCFPRPDDYIAARIASMRARIEEIEQRLRENSENA